MKIHNPASHEELANLAPVTAYTGLLKNSVYFDVPEGVSLGHPHVHFNHLLHGYDAGYYSYLWGFVFGADIFETAFAADTANRETWERYKRIILEPGGSRDELKSVEEFLGRPISPEPLFRRLREEP